jgi:hypothetical protein
LAQQYAAILACGEEVSPFSEGWSSVYYSVVGVVPPNPTGLRSWHSQCKVLVSKTLRQIGGRRKIVPNILFYCWQLKFCHVKYRYKGKEKQMFGLAFLAILGYMMYIEIITFFENRRDMKRTQEYFKNRSWQADTVI